MSSKINLGVPEFILKMGNPNGRYVYEFGDFRLDAGHRMLYHNGKELALAPKAVETLVALVERRGEIMSKDELLEAVWPDAVVEESNLFVYLSVLRKTLGTKESGDPWVETLRRRGYRFSGDVRLVSVQNGGNGIPYIKPAALRLVHATSDIRPTMPENAPSEPRAKRTRLRTIYAVAGLAVVVVAVLAFTYKYFLNPRINSIAVIPFVNETQDPELDFLANEMTENFIDSLSKVSDLKVQSRSSISRYKGKEIDPKVVGAELGVDAILCGRVIKRGEDIDLDVELVDTHSGARVWRKTDTRKMGDLIVLGRRIQQDLVLKLGYVQSGPTQTEISRNDPINTDAFRLYLKGRAYSLKLTRSEILEGIGYLNQAIDQDPGYAKAYASIARAHLILGIAGEVHPDEFIEAKRAAEKAIELDGFLAEGYSALASVAFFYTRDFTEAENLYKRALELDPKSATVHQNYADFLNKNGRHDEGEAEIARAMELEPFSPFINAFYAASIRDNKAALEQIRVAIARGPDNYILHLFAGEIYRRNEMYDEAVAELRRAKELSPQTWSDVALIGALINVGKTDEARMIADRMLRDSKTCYVPPTHLALAYKQLGDRDRALAYLEEGYDMHDPKMVFLNEPQWNDHEDPQYQEMLRRIGFAL